MHTPSSITLTVTSKVQHYEYLGTEQFMHICMLIHWPKHNPHMANVHLVSLMGHDLYHLTCMSLCDNQITLDYCSIHMCATNMVQVKMECRVSALQICFYSTIIISA